MILVTGGTGLVGAHLLVKLAQENQLIRAIYRTEVKKKYVNTFFLHCFPSEGQGLFDSIDWVKASINDIPELSVVFENVTHVYHCAALISFDPKEYRKLRKVNIEGTANIVNLCLIYSIKKLCYVSSIATLGEDSMSSMVDETTEWNPEVSKSVYAISKYGAEMEVWRGAQEGLNTVIVNPGIIIGSGFFNTGSGYLFKRIYKGMKYFTTGSTGYVAIEDVIKIMRQLMNGDFSNQRYILVGENLSYKNAFSMIAEALNKPAPTKKVSPFLLKIVCSIQWIGFILFRVDRSIFKSSIKSAFSTTYYKNDKIRKELTYSFIPIKKAIKETATLFLEQG